MNNVRCCYGFVKNDSGDFIVNETEALVIKFIFDLYLKGESLEGISRILNDKKALTPSKKRIWNRASVNAILSNVRYAKYIIPIERFMRFLDEKQIRTNVDIATNTRKTARYSSKNVLSGLLVCEKCGRNYRRITYTDGEIVWRCASRVERGKKICKYSPTIWERDVKEILIKYIGNWDEEKIKMKIDRILVCSDGILRIEEKPIQE